MTRSQEILQSARINEMRRAVMETAALCRAPAVVELTRPPHSRRRLLMLLVRERRRNAKLSEMVAHG